MIAKAGIMNGTVMLARHSCFAGLADAHYVWRPHPGRSPQAVLNLEHHGPRIASPIFYSTAGGKMEYQQGGSVANASAPSRGVAAWVSLAAVLLAVLAGCTSRASQPGKSTGNTAPLPLLTQDCLLMVFAAPTAGKQVEFDHWYENHLQQFVAIPGVKSARRYSILRVGAVGGPLPPSLALYGLEGSQVALVDAEVGLRTKGGRITRSDAVDYDGIVSLKMRPLGPAMLAEDVPGAIAEPLGAGVVKEYGFIVFSNPSTPGREEEFNNWYDHQHMPDVLRIPGFVSAQRFVTMSASPNSTLPRYLIIFTLRSGDLAATNAEIARRLREHITIPSASMGAGVGAFMEPQDQTNPREIH